MATTTRLTLFVVGLVLAVTAGWALGDVTAALFPRMPVPGPDLDHLAHLRGAPGS